MQFIDLLFKCSQGAIIVCSEYEEPINPILKFNAKHLKHIKGFVQTSSSIIMLKGHILRVGPISQRCLPILHHSLFSVSHILYFIYLLYIYILK